MGQMVDTPLTLRFLSKLTGPASCRDRQNQQLDLFFCLSLRKSISGLSMTNQGQKRRFNQ